MPAEVYVIGKPKGLSNYGHFNDDDVNNNVDKKVITPKARRSIETILVDILGENGSLQMRIFGFTFLSSLVSAWNSLIMAFAAPNVDYWCADESFQAAVAAEANRTMLNTTNQCLVDNLKCQRWSYDVGRADSEFHRTLTSKFNLVCDQSWLPSMAQSAYMFGMLSATFIMSHFSDRFGRKPIILTGLLLNTIGNLSALGAPTMMHFSVARYITAFGGATHWSTGFVLLTELAGPRYREFFGIGVQFGWAAGYILLPGLVLAYPDYGYVLGAAAIVQFVQFVAGFSILVESPRWLLVNGRTSQAVTMLIDVNESNLAKVYKSHRQKNDDDDDDDGKHPKKDFNDLINELKESNKAAASCQPQDTKRYTVLDLFTKRSMALMTIITLFLWLTNNLVYYGLSLNSNELSGNRYINFFALGLVEFPAYLFCLFAVRRWGAKRPLWVLLVGAALGCFGATSITYNQALGMGFAMLGKLCVTGSFALVYVYTASIYPTVMRTIGMGTGAMVGKAGSLLSPFIKELIVLTHVSVPLLMFGGMALLAATLMQTLPETKDSQLPDRVEDIVATGEKDQHHQHQHQHKDTASTV